MYKYEDVLAAAFSARLAETAAWLCSCPPVVLDLADVRVVPMFEGWSHSHTAAVLNAALVGLVSEHDVRDLQGLSAEAQRVCH